MNAEFFGDHPALDLLNTVRQVNGQPVDSWQSNADVAAWLAQAGYLPAGAQAGPALLAVARELRESVRALVAQRKAGQLIDPAPLNVLLAQASRHMALVRDGNGALMLTPVYASDTPQRLLAPLAEAAAELLAGDFALVKHCENPACTLWFVDRTKSHRRRWCSMAVCGNRHKVASFRQRKAVSV